MVKPRLTGLIAFGLYLSFQQPALSAWPVTDAQAIVKATEQLNRMKEQLDKLNEMKKQIDEQIKIIGSYGKITLPIINIANMGNQLKKDMQCLKPDWEELIPGINFEEQKFSLCDRSRFYRDNLWVDPVKVGGESVFGVPGQSSAIDHIKWQKERQRVRMVRQAVLHESVTNAMAQADKAIENTKENSEAIDDLQGMVDGAQTDQDRQAAIAQGQVVLARIGNQRNQTLAQLLKVAAAFAMEAGIPLERYGVDLEKTEGAK